MASVVLSRSPDTTKSRSTVAGSRAATAKADKHDEQELKEKALKRERQCHTALSTWSFHKKLEKNVKTKYLKEKVNLQRMLIEKNDQLKAEREEEEEGKRREVKKQRRDVRLNLVQTVREKERKIQGQRRKTVPSLPEQSEDDKEEHSTSSRDNKSRLLFGGSSIPSYPGGRGHLDPPPDEFEEEEDEERSSSNSNSSSPPSSTSSDTGGAKESKLASVLKGFNGPLEIELMWNLLKAKNERKLAKHRHHCQRLRSDPTMSPFMKQCLATYDMAVDRQIKFLWDDIRQQSLSDRTRHHSFPPAKSGSFDSCSASQLSLMFRAAVENGQTASMMLSRKNFRESIVGDCLPALMEHVSVSQTAPDNLQPFARGGNSTISAHDQETENRCVRQKDSPSVGLDRESDPGRNPITHLPSNLSAGPRPTSTRDSKSCDSHATEHLPTIVEETRSTVMVPLPPPREGCVRTFSAQSMAKHSTLFSRHEEDVQSADRRRKARTDRRLWHHLDCHSLLDSNVFKTQSASVENEDRAFRHGACPQWKVASSSVSSQPNLPS